MKSMYDVIVSFFDTHRQVGLDRSWLFDEKKFRSLIQIRIEWEL